MNRLQFGKLMTRLFNTNPSPSFESTSVSLRRDLASMLQAGAEDDSFYRKLGKNADGTVRRDAASAQDPAANGSGNAVPQEVNQSDQPQLESGSSDPAVPCAAAIAGGAAAAQEPAANGSGNAVPQEVNQSDQPPLESGSSDPAVPCAAAIAGGAAAAQAPAANGSGNAVPQEVNQSDQPPLESGSSDPAVPCAAAIAGGAAAAQELAAYGADAPCESSSIRPATTAVVRTSGQGNLHKKKPPSKKDCWKQKGKRTTFARPKNKSSEPIPIRTRPPNAPGARCDYQIALGEGLPNPIFDQVG